MTVASNWFLRLAGHDPHRTRVLAGASRAADQRLLERDLAIDETRFRVRMDDVARRRHVVLGTTTSGVPYRISLDDLITLPSWITAATGAGKSRFIGAFMERTLTQIVQGDLVSIVVIDGKGETDDQLLRSAALIAEGLPARQRESFLSRVHTFRFFDKEYLPRWPLLAPISGVSIAVQADAVAEVLSEIVADATFGPRQRATLAAILALAIEFEIPAAALPWLLNSPAEVGAFGARSSLPSVRLDLSRFERESQSSIDGIIARLGTLLRVPSVKAVLSGDRRFDCNACFEPGSITTVGFGGAELGSRSAVRALGSLWLSALANAAFDPRRVIRGKTIILVDEPQAFLTSVSLGQFERLVTLGRSFGAGGVVFVHQGPSQLPQEFQTLLNTNVPLRVLGRSSERDSVAAAEWLPRTGRVPRPREPGPRQSAHTQFLSEGQEERFRIAEIGRLPARHFLIADRRTAFAPRIVRAPDYDPPPWSKIHPSVAKAVLRGSAGVPRAVLEARVREIEAQAAVRFEEAQRNEAVSGKRRGRSPVTPDVVGQAHEQRRRGEVP